MLAASCERNFFCHADLFDANASHGRIKKEFVKTVRSEQIRVAKNDSVYGFIAPAKNRIGKPQMDTDTRTQIYL